MGEAALNALASDEADEEEEPEGSFTMNRSSLEVTFQQIDADGNGRIDLAEMVRVLPSATPDELSRMIDDVSGTKTLDFEQFLKLMQNWQATLDPT